MYDLDKALNVMPTSNLQEIFNSLQNDAVMNVLILLVFALTVGVILLTKRNKEYSNTISEQAAEIVQIKLEAVQRKAKIEQDNKLGLTNSDNEFYKRILFYYEDQAQIKTIPLSVDVNIIPKKNESGKYTLNDVNLLYRKTKPIIMKKTGIPKERISIKNWCIVDDIESWGTVRESDIEEPIFKHNLESYKDYSQLVREEYETEPSEIEQVYEVVEEQ